MTDLEAAELCHRLADALEDAAILPTWTARLRELGDQHQRAADRAHYREEPA